ncbi:hypothetical protein SOM08_08130 [Hydrogenophaga sp. SNF1]|uniref:hypothetical protein n=1 Tax=Hydrogenophaga sp. SNF1 TaxID=3098762 RepID=UPI002ACBFD4F|nr:hypothetical protein [Hydrogenophaga sp. SNF1]WQB85281.1 hypothetical protein SOM08_08130 [Hydrogenophaga sp. SNF1]
MKAIPFFALSRAPSPVAALARCLGRRLRAAPAALWRAARRHAERPQRVVPYY